MTDVKARLEKHYNRAVEHYGEHAVLGVFLYGSWNYNTNTPDSDVDTKCILIPSLYDLAIKPLEVKHLHIDDEVCECMSIMHMVANWKKQNINFVEIMFTDYCIINPMYQELWCGYFNKDRREMIARYDLRQAIHSMTHQAIHTIKQDPTDPKKIMNGLRIIRTLDALLNSNAGYKECIWMRDDVREHRFQAPDADFVDLLLVALEGELEMLDVYAPNEDIKEVINCFLNSFILDLIKYRMKF
jgi:hypothetical protein